MSAWRYLGLGAAILAALGLWQLVGASGPDGVLDKEAQLERFDWWDNRDWGWYEARIPFFESPDPEIDATYYYRWEVLTKHLVYGSPETGYTLTEFIDRPFWSGTYGAISCPLGHQAYELRWLKDRRVIEDFARYWFETPGAEPRSYSNWYGDAMWATYQVWRDDAFLQAVYPHMQAQLAGWKEERWDPEHGMFVWDGMHDGMETNINSRQTDDTFSGAPGYRPTLNSYVYGDLRALARTANVLGDDAAAARWTGEAEALRGRIVEELWDPERRFFFHQFARDEKDGIEAKSLTYETGPHAGSSHGRELIGYVPWQFRVPPRPGEPDPSGRRAPTYEDAWAFLRDPEHFRSEYGPTTTERHDPLFRISPRCCVWSGNSWPYATSQTLVAAANLLNEYEQDVFGPDDWFRLLETYTRTQRKAGRPYVAEAAHPFTGSWAGHDWFYHSEHYLHSGYIDLVVTGLVGLRPQSGDSLVVNPLVPRSWAWFALDDVAYHGHSVSVVWDRDGSRYGQGAGLRVLVDGREVAAAPELGRLAVAVPPPPRYAPPPRPVNFAVNNGGRFFPSVSASFSPRRRPVHYAVDGHYWYHPSPPNRWTTQGSPNSTDWIEIDFGVERPVSELRLYFLDDRTAVDEVAALDGRPSWDMERQGAPVQPPASYEVLRWDGDGWAPLAGAVRTPAEPRGRRPNVVSFDAPPTARFRVVLTPRPGAAVGLTELEAWGEAELPLSPATAPVANLAFNSGDAPYPRLTSSLGSRGGDLGRLTDSRSALMRRTDNVWSMEASPNPSDWIEVDFGEPRTVGSLELHLWGDGEGTTAPRAYTVQYRTDAGWADARALTRTPGAPAVMAVNTVEIAPVRTDRVRVVFDHRPPGKTALTELVVWEAGAR